MHRLAIVVVALLPLLSVSEEPRFELDQLSFIAGEWEGELFGGHAEESWMPPHGGSMVGSFRLTWPERGKRLYELFLIEEEADGSIALVFRHFGPGMTLWKNEVDAPLRFVLTELSASRAVFAAPDKAQKPGRFIFESAKGGKALHITVQTLGEDGQVAEEFRADYRVRSDKSGGSAP